MAKSYLNEVATVIEAAKQDYAIRKKVNIKYFVDYCELCLEAKDGYIMGSKGQDPKTLRDWYYNQYKDSSSAYKKSLYWKEHCERVHDCQGMVDGFLTAVLGKTTDVRARNNYASWCSPKKEVSKPEAIPAEYRVPGAAVFIYSSDKKYITHVGYLTDPVDPKNPNGDWYVVEAKGVMYGVVETQLYSRGWNRVGLMTEYFDYSEVGSGATKPVKPTTVYKFGERILKKDCEGADVKELQSILIDLGFDCGKYGADGEFGNATLSAVKAYQKSKDLSVDGIVGEKTYEAINRDLQEEDSNDPIEYSRSVRMYRGTNLYIRSMSGAIKGIMKLNQEYPYTGETTTLPEVSDSLFYVIEYIEGEKACVSSAYTKIVEKKN